LLQVIRLHSHHCGAIQLLLKKNNHLGTKSMYATCTFNLTCNHRRHILHTTRGGPGHWNNRTMVRFDTFLTSVQYGSILDDNDFGVRISTTWISRSGDLSFSHQEKNLGLNLKFPKRFLTIFSRDLTLSSILIIY
jgi:hypothetical protein